VEGVGSTFAIELPAHVDAAVDAAVAGAVAGAVAASTAGTEQGGSSETQGSTIRRDAQSILVIDDDSHARELLRRTLEKQGHTVTTASGGREGLALAGQLQPALITLDVMMPDLDGWAVLRALKADAETHHIPVIMISMVGDREIGYTLGAVESMTKPVDRTQLVALVQEHLLDPGAQILVVEDDEATRNLISRSLREVGWQVVEADNGTSALARVAEHKPDLILLDLMMPIMDGFDFVAELRKGAGYFDIPIIVVTAKDLNDADRRRLAGGVERIIEKGSMSQERLLQELTAMVAAVQ